MKATTTEVQVEVTGTAAPKMTEAVRIEASIDVEANTRTDAFQMELEYRPAQTILAPISYASGGSYADGKLHTIPGRVVVRLFSNGRTSLYEKKLVLTGIDFPADEVLAWVKDLAPLYVTRPLVAAIQGGLA